MQPAFDVMVLFCLQDKKESDEEMKMKYICAYWTEEGTWSTNGCEQESNTSTHTVCVCHHLSSFAVLMALYPIKVQRT